MIKEKNQKSKIKFIKDNTYSEPPPAGPTALDKDMAVIDMPLAAPLLFWVFN